MNTCVRGTLILASCLFVLPAFGQETRTEQIEREKASKAAAVHPEAREKGDVIITRLERLFRPDPPALKPTFGDFRLGAGLAAGVAYALPTMANGLWTTEAAWSINNFKQVQSTLEMQRAAAGRVKIATTFRWNDAPDLTFFGLRNDSVRGNETHYALRWIEAGVQSEGHAYRWFRYAAGIGYLGTDSPGGRGPAFTSERLPGLGSNPNWIDATASAAIDTRESPGYTRWGALYSVAFHRYENPDNKFSFDRTEIDLRQFVPVLHDNWIIALQARADITSAAADQVIPYFMLPSIGGRDTVRGFDSYRFTDRHSLLLRSELRWTASPVVDMALFVDHGKVAGKIEDLNLRGLHRGLGIGVRFHGPTFTAFRLEVAHSVEGFHFNVGHSISF